MHRGCWLLVVGIVVTVGSCASEPEHDIVIRGGILFDGTGAERSSGDIAIDGERIVAIGKYRVSVGEKSTPADCTSHQASRTCIPIRS